MRLLISMLSILISVKVKAEFLPTSFSAKFEQEYISILKGNMPFSPRVPNNHIVPTVCPCYHKQT